MNDNSSRPRRSTLTKNPFSLRDRRLVVNTQEAPSTRLRSPSEPCSPSPFARSSSRERESHQRTQSSNFELSQQSPLLPNIDFSTPTDAYNLQLSFPGQPLKTAMDDQSTPLTLHTTTSLTARPPPPQQTHTSPDLRGNESLRMSQNGSTNVFNNAVEITPPRSETGAMSPKRFSGETQPVKLGRAGRKKSGFSSFVNSMLGSPRQIRISAPENPTHITHVCFDNETGQFTVSVRAFIASHKAQMRLSKNNSD